MLKIAICDEEGIKVEYIERLILENIKVKESAKIYKYTEPQKIQYDSIAIRRKKGTFCVR